MVSELGGTVAALHGPLPGTPADVGAVFAMQPIDAAVVLGSTQSETVVDHEVAGRLGLGLCRRRSGGGLVVIDPIACRWVDVLVPTGHVLASDDVHAVLDWLGAVWVSAIAALGGVATSHLGASEHAEAGRVVCFAGMGRGEVSVSGRKLIGISQRRDRRGARFQCIVYSRFDVASHLSLLASGADRRLVERGLAGGVATWPDPGALIAAFVDALPS